MILSILHQHLKLTEKKTVSEKIHQKYVEIMVKKNTYKNDFIK